ncbi:helix-turn-helix domain-containing protein [Kitasatospora sp. NPDC058965]|uniref:PucR family transcriptional regulator n=1 Tax=Kitasatospora sp. NPDC058965 TaxID=3346682 RepID=UPI003696FDF1
MSEVAEVSAGEPGDRPAQQQTLLGLLTLVGDVVGPGPASGGLDRTVRRLVMVDDVERDIARGDLLVAVAVDPRSEQAAALVRKAGGAGAAGVVFRSVETAAGSEALREAAAEAGTAVLYRNRSIRWAPVIGLLEAALSVAREPGIAGVPLGDLPELAKAIALQVGGSVTIEDMDFKVLAYSPVTAGSGVDGVRISTILERQPPAHRLDDMASVGFDRDLKRSTTVLYRELQGDAPERLIVMVRAGDIPLGSIWVAAVGGQPLNTPAHHEALSAAGRAAAAHLLHDRARREGQDDRLLDAARLLLDGQGSAELLAARTGWPTAQRCAVLSVWAGPGAVSDGPERSALVKAAFRHCSERGELSVVLPGPNGALVLLGSLARDPGQAGEQVRLLAESLVAQVSKRLGRPVRVGIGEVQERLDLAPASRRTADLALGGLQFGRGGRGCAQVGEVADAVALRHLVAALGTAAQELPVETPVARLLAHALRKGDASLLEALGAFLDQPGAKAKAADALGVPRGTYAHRLDHTVVRESGIDLEDPVARLLAQLQLWVHRAAQAAQD